MCYLKAKYIRDVRFQALWCLELFIRSMWCLMLNSRKSPEVRAFYRFHGWISCIEYKPVRKVGSTWVSKGQCFETPAFGAAEASKIARNCFRFSMSCGCSCWILKFQIRLTELQVRLLNTEVSKSDCYMFQIRAECLDLGLPGS